MLIVPHGACEVSRGGLSTIRIPNLCVVCHFESEASISCPGRYLNDFNEPNYHTYQKKHSVS